jgi:hypothetical protein
MNLIGFAPLEFGDLIIHRHVQLLSHNADKDHQWSSRQWVRRMHYKVHSRNSSFASIVSGLFISRTVIEAHV